MSVVRANRKSVSVSRDKQDVIYRLIGTNTDVAIAMGVNPRAVAAWKERERVPVIHWDDITQLAERGLESARVMLEALNA